jgi:hypothetical protein
MSNNIFAYTALGSNYPEYISVNTDDGQNVMVTVRGPVQNGNCGQTVCVLLSPEQVDKFISALMIFKCQEQS